jgi:lipopolysaccharide/colanic/teichoic acid biosynthesis glycosyltransferase
VTVDIKNRLKYLFRFTLLQISLTIVTIYYFDNFLIGDYENGFNIISNNLLEDKNRFYSFIPNEYIKIDIFLAIFIFIFLIGLYSTKFYTYVNELTFTVDKSFLDEYFSIYLVWSASFLSFMQLLRFSAVSRGYLVLYTFIVPFILVVFRNSEFISSLLGRNVTNENYISFNLEELSIFSQLRILKFRNNLSNYTVDINKNFLEVKNKIEELSKESQLNLIVINLKDISELDSEFEKYLINLNKKILLISNTYINFESNFYYRVTQISNKNIIYINNDIQYGSNYIFKRLIDITVSILALIILSPLIIYISIIVVMKAGNPILVKQTRVGLHGRNFLMYKFRTMKKDSHLERVNLGSQNKKNGPLFKIENDPRIISGLQFMRKYSIDEIPQFLNVLKGQMSIVGPRPLFPEDNKHYDSIFIRRLNVLPGITGLLQINERNTDDFEVWHKYDVAYIDNWSVYLDLKIIFKTPFSIFFRKTEGL